MLNFWANIEKERRLQRRRLGASLIPHASERGVGASIAPDDLWPISGHFESALDASEDEKGAFQKS